MNTVKAGAKYVGEGTTEHGIRFTEVTVAAVGKGEDIKLRVLSTKAGGDTLGSCSKGCLLYTSPSPRDHHLSRMPSSA